MAMDPLDGGFKSRKWLAFLVSSILILLAGKFVSAAVIAEVVFGLVSCLGIYSGSNVGRDWVMSKGNVAFPPAANPTQVNAAVNVQPQAPADAKSSKKPAKQEEEGS